MNFADTDKRWDLIRDRFRQACVLRREGRSADAAAVMEGEIAPMLAEWTQEASASAPERRQRVESMLAEEMRRVEDACYFETRLGEQMEQRLRKLVGECTNMAAERLRENEKEGGSGRTREITKELTQQWESSLEEVTSSLREEIRAAAARPAEDFARLTEPIQQQLRALRELHDLDAQALHDRFSGELKTALGELLDRQTLLQPLREEVHSFLAEIRNEWRLVRESQEPSLRNLLTPVQADIRELTEELGERMRAEQRENREAMESVVNDLRREVNEFRELPNQAIKAQTESLRKDVDALLGNPRREMRKMLEPIREDLAVLRQESKGKALHAEWAELRKLVEAALAERREDVREMLAPLSERVEEIAEGPVGEVRALRESVAEILDAQRGFRGKEVTEQLGEVCRKLEKVTDGPLEEFRDVSGKLQEFLSREKGHSLEALFAELGALRADMETLWLNPSEDAEGVVRPLRDALKDFRKQYGREELENLIAPLSKDVEAMRKRLGDLCAVIHHAGSDWRDREKQQREEIAEANRAAARSRGLKESRRQLLRALIGEGVEEPKGPRVPVWDVAGVIDSILADQADDAA